MVELVISMVVIAIALAGTLEVHRAALFSSADALAMTQASSIAQAYLEEVLLRPVFDPDLGSGGGACPAAEASRALYDNVCDFDGLDDSGARDQTGTAIAGLGAYRVRVTVDETAQLGDLSGAPDVLRVDVRVTRGTAADVLVSGHRTTP